VAELPDDASADSPLKRDSALVPLSRDHHFALMHALALRRVGEAGSRWAVAGPVSTAEAFLAFYEDELIGHMADEEEALLPFVERAEPEHSRRLREDHERLAEQVADLRQALENGTELRALMRAIGDDLHDHVRFEERVFFEAIQQRLAPEEMGRVGQALETHRRDRGRAEGCILPRRVR
jgi:iron-sulfur cluster repair protein YtfE (RIC family)